MYDLNQCLFSSQQIRQAEQAAYANSPTASYRLMAMAGEAAFKLLQQYWPMAKQLMIFCGAGNNAGDGYIVARLARQANLSVTVISLIDLKQLPGDAQLACQAYQEAGGLILDFKPTMLLNDKCLVVDAMFGIGLNRPLTENYLEAIKLINANAHAVLAIDIPTGLQADSGLCYDLAVKADITITFIALKAGLFTGQAADYVGKVVLADLGLANQMQAAGQPLARLLTKTPLPPRARSSHKGVFGHVLLIGGNIGYSGAIRLAGEAALRCGAGLVTIASRTVHAALLNIGRPELMCHGVETTEELASLIAKANVIVLGPGLGQDDWAYSMFKAILACEKSCVFDADALNLLAKYPVRRDNWVLTPHPGEAARLLSTSSVEIAEDRYLAVSKLQQAYGGVIILKGAGTLLNDGRQTLVATNGNPGMASGGMGDVLSGIIGSLLAQGLALSAAAQLAVYVHGEAADKAASKLTEVSLLASDLFSELGNCLQSG